MANIEIIRNMRYSKYTKEQGYYELDIIKLKELCKQSSIKWSAHCLERMQERDISRNDVKNCIMNGEMIEDYPADYPHPSCLIYGYTLSDKVLHVVAGTDNITVYIITAYFPNSEKFQEDLKTRRER